MPPMAGYLFGCPVAWKESWKVRRCAMTTLDALLLGALLNLIFWGIVWVEK